MINVSPSTLESGKCYHIIEIDIDEPRSNAAIDITMAILVLNNLRIKGMFDKKP